MQRALEKEPQVAILMNTAPQLIPGGLMVPETIAVDAVLTDMAQELGSNARVPEPWSGRVPLGRILELDRERACAWSAAGMRSHLPPARISLPSCVAPQNSLVLTTTIRTFGVHQLREYASGLTYPLIVNGWLAGKDLEFTYHLCGKPGFHLTRTTRQDDRYATNSKGSYPESYEVGS